jgi:RNA ligase (TIGR02306 family)
MARKLASVVEISEILPIEGADKLELAKMKGKGWQVVVQKGEFNIGDLAVYAEIDSFLPSDDDRYAFLRERCLRRFVSKSGNVLREGIKIKTIKLRGQISQGLLMPLAKFPEITSRIIEGKFLTCTKDEWQNELDKICAESNEPLDVVPYAKEDYIVELIGADVTKLLKVEHYDEVKEQLQPAMGNPICADALGKFPSDYIPKTDEERIQNLGDWFEKMKGRVWQVSCKHDGTSCTIAYSKMIDEGNPEIVCSRNLRLKPESADGKIPVYWQMAKQYDMLNKLKGLSESMGIEYAVQGEIVGPGINKCRNKEQTYKFLVFRIYDITNQKLVNPTDTVQMCKSLGLEHVQIVKDNFAFFDEIKTMDEALKFAEGKTAEGNEREGVVLKTIDTLPYASFKIVSNKYLMKQED